MPISFSRAQLTKFTWSEACSEYYKITKKIPILLSKCYDQNVCYYQNSDQNNVDNKNEFVSLYACSSLYSKPCEK